MSLAQKGELKTTKKAGRLITTPAWVKEWLKKCPDRQKDQDCSRAAPRGEHHIKQSSTRAGSSAARAIVLRNAKRLRQSLRAT